MIERFITVISIRLRLAPISLYSFLDLKQFLIGTNAPISEIYITTSPGKRSLFWGKFIFKILIFLKESIIFSIISYQLSVIDYYLLVIGWLRERGVECAEVGERMVRMVRGR